MAARADGSNPRAQGTNPRARGTNPRARRVTVVLDRAVTLKTSDGVAVAKLVGLELEVDLTRVAAWEPLKEGSSSVLRNGLSENTNAEGDGSLREGVSLTPIETVWRHYVAVMKPRGGRLEVVPDQESRIIRDALKVATVEECKRAVDGCFGSDFHMKRGQYARREGRRYASLSHILRGKQGIRTTREQIDLFLDIVGKSGMQSRVSSEDAVRLRQARQAIRDAAEFPGDEHVVDRGRRAEAWLIEQGWTVDRMGEQITFVPPADLSA